MSRGRQRQRQQTRSRRVIFLGIVVIACLVLGIGVYFLAPGKSRKLSRADGMSAAADGDFVPAIRALGQSLRDQPEDAEGWATFALARERVLAPDQSQLSQAAAAWKRAVDLAPDEAKYWGGFAKMSAALGDWQSAIRGGKKAFELDPDNPEWAHVWIGALIATKNEPEAREVLQRVDDSLAAKWQIQNDWVLVERLANHSLEPVIAKLKSRCADPAADPALAGVLALAVRLHTSAETAETLFRAAAETAPPDPDYIRWLVPSLDECFAPDAVLPLFERVKEVLSDPRLQLLFARRAWESGRADLLLKQLAGVPMKLSTDPELIALYCLALRATVGESAALTKVSEFLEQMSQTPGETLWRPALRVVVTSDTCDAATGVEALYNALKITPSAPALHYALGECWMRLGEYRMAAKSAVQCSRFSPYWLGPRSLEVSAYIRGSLADEAYGAAFRNFSLQPDSAEAALAFGTAWLMVAEPGNGSGPGTLNGLKAWLVELKEKLNDSRRDAVDILQVQVLTRLGDFDAAEETLRALQSPDQTNKDRPEIAVLQQQIERERKRVKDRESAAQSDPQMLVGNAQSDAEIPPNSKTLVTGELASTKNVPRPKIHEATAWRLAEARELLSLGTSEKLAAEAASILRPIFDQLPDHPDAHLLAGVALARLRDNKKAADHFMQAIEGDWRRSFDAMQLALGCRNDGNWDDPTEIVQLWATATRLSERLADLRKFQRASSGKDADQVEDLDALNDSVIIRLLVLAELAESTSDQPLAEAAYRELLQLDESQPAVLNNLAMSLVSSPNQLDEALQLAQKAVALEPKNEAFADTLLKVQEAVKTRLKLKSSNHDASSTGQAPEKHENSP